MTRSGEHAPALGLDIAMAIDDQPIFHAAYINDLARIRAEVASGVDPNARHTRAGTTPLELACKGNALDAIKLLIELGANPSLAATKTSRVSGRVFEGTTPLMHVRSTEAAAMLLDAGAELEAKDGAGSTPLAHAVAGYDVVLVRYFIARGASFDTHLELDGKSWSLIGYIDAKVAFWEALPESEATRVKLDTLVLMRAVLKESGA